MDASSRARSRQPLAIHFQPGDIVSFLLQVKTGVEDRRMLHAGRDDMVALPPLCRRHPLDGQIIGFGAAGSEDDLHRFAAQESPPTFPWPLQLPP